MKIKKSALDLIGKTPLLELCKIEDAHNLDNIIIGKMEFLNCAGSIKDRVGLEMIEDAERKGLIKPGATLIEPTSGNTGIGIAAVAAAKGYKAILTMPETMSVERRNVLLSYGAEIVLTEGSKGMAGAIEKADELAKEIDGSMVLGQFENRANAEAHIKTTGPEIYEDMDGNIDYLIATVGTGGTITGVGEYLKSKNEKIKVIAVEPEGSQVLSGGKAGSHLIQGIGAGFVPKVLNTSIYDEVISVSNEDAYRYGQEIARTEGILVGISSGAAVAAAVQVSNRQEVKGKNIVVILPDSGDRYLSTPRYFHK